MWGKKTSTSLIEGYIKDINNVADQLSSDIKTLKMVLQEMYKHNMMMADKIKKYETRKKK